MPARQKTEVVTLQEMAGGEAASWCSTIRNCEKYEKRAAAFKKNANSDSVTIKNDFLPLLNPLETVYIY